MTTWDVCMSPGNTYEWIIKLGQANTLQKQLGYTSQACKPCTCLALRPKTNSRVSDRATKGKKWDVLHVWSERVLERHPLWIAGDRQNTAVVFFTWGGIKSLPVIGGINSWLSHWLHWFQWKPVEGHIPLIALQSNYSHRAEVFSLLMYQQTVILKRPWNAEGITRRGVVTSYIYSYMLTYIVVSDSLRLHGP